MSAQGSGTAVSRTTPSGGTLADVLDRVLDKGVVIEAWAAVSLLGIEILSVQAKVVVASVETYLKYADEVASVGAEPEKKEVKPMPAATPAPAKAAPAEALPSEEELMGFLMEHASGLKLDQIVEHFHANRKQLEASVSHLLSEHRLRRDDARGLLLPMAK